MTVGVYGLGRFGQLWAEILSTRFDVKGYNRSPLSEIKPNIPVVGLNELLQCDVLFLCVSISGMEEVCKKIAPHLSPNTMVMDTCSVKVYPAEVMERNLPKENPVIATHPMFGPDSVVSGLRNLPFIMCNVSSSEDKFNEWMSIFKCFGFNVFSMTPDEHDREAAFTQGITHFIGRVLKDLKIEPSPIATLGYQKLMEVMEQTCNDPWQLFIDLQKQNPHTQEMREELKKSLDRILAQL
jgi:prephenate dehydrogenase